MNAQSAKLNLYALLIGIDEYENQDVGTLRGCVNDVEAIRILLTSRFNVPEDHILMLTNEYATRTSILQNFVEFLIGNPNIQYGDHILIHYSGYGSQMPI